MKYRTDLKSGRELSALGFGCMRFPRGPGMKIDIPKSEALMISAIERGINYFDTGYIYAGNEQALGEILRRNQGMREKIYLSTKLPFNQCKEYADFDRIFNIQLERLGTDYIDYYLMHKLTSVADWERIRLLGIEDWIAQKKSAGQIKQIGFSFHGVQSEFLALLDQYDWEFCMIQYNYINENYQAGRKGLIKAHEKGLPVMIMEPLLGGKLANLPKKAKKLLHEQDSTVSAAAWALRWLWNHRQVTVVLSGMGSMQQLDDNIKTADTADIGMMTDSDAETIGRVTAIFKESYKIPCTECNYCLPCPKGVNIPVCFTAYNVSYASGFAAGMTLYSIGTDVTNPDKNYGAKNCIKCGKCEKHCPQNIKIMQSLDRVQKRMEPFWFNAAMKIVRKVMG
ncbi:MAG: aldo/keto reductase [Oscillospiraceae bacterium]|nr:aldo/keto reductase [Oscillospiraceae bacterium]